MRNNFFHLALLNDEKCICIITRPNIGATLGFSFGTDDARSHMLIDLALPLIHYDYPAGYLSHIKRRVVAGVLVRIFPIDESGDGGSFFQRVISKHGGALFPRERGWRTSILSHQRHALTVADHV